VSDSVIRFLTVRVDLDLKRAEKFKARRKMKKERSERTRPSKGIKSEKTVTAAAGDEKGGSKEGTASSARTRSITSTSKM
jgi:hypothetical protein